MRADVLYFLTNMQTTWERICRTPELYLFHRCGILFLQKWSDLVPFRAGIWRKCERPGSPGGVLSIFATDFTFQIAGNRL